MSLLVQDHQFSHDHFAKKYFLLITDFSEKIQKVKYRNKWTLVSSLYELYNDREGNLFHKRFLLLVELFYSVQICYMIFVSLR